MDLPVQLQQTSTAPHRLVTFGPDIHSAYIWIAIILCLVCSAMAITIRIGVKWNMFGLDDYFIFLSMFAHVGQAAAVFYSLRHGLGRSDSTASPDEWVLAGKVRKGKESIVLQQIMVTWTIASATVPNLKGFMRAFHTGLGTMGQEGSSRQTTLKSSSYVLQTIGGSLMKGAKGARLFLSHGHQGSQEESREELPRLRSNTRATEARVEYLDDSASIQSKEETGALWRSSSRELIIRKRVEWEDSHGLQ
ncbi:hypothetical protein BD289DRAFT_480904 [Coniella lustricola]|uniref:Integral membrane protein n=1 Tax=Coniella lustricola TaxID=2025994 RepID=A0A2T3ADZ6_9PEZI|nr:hypothetical protein BD289DRAFT_480904 [Coniella lustricola]